MWFQTQISHFLVHVLSIIQIDQNSYNNIHLLIICDCLVCFGYIFYQIFSLI